MIHRLLVHRLAAVPCAMAAVLSCTGVEQAWRQDLPVKARLASVISTKSSVATEDTQILPDSLSLGRVADADMWVTVNSQDWPVEALAPTKGAEFTGSSLDYVDVDAFLDDDTELDDDLAEVPASHYIDGGWFYKTGNTFSDVVSNDGDNTPYYWVHKVDLHIWGHRLATGATMSWDSDDHSKATITYSMPVTTAKTGDAAAQEDMLISYNKQQYSDANGGVIDFHLYHALSAIWFDISELPSGAAVSNIKLVGVYSGGTCDVSISGGKPEFDWTAGSGKASYGQDYETDDFIAETTTVAYEKVLDTSTGRMFLVMPQELPADAKLGVTFILNGVTEDYREVTIGSKGLSNMEWKPGKMYTYRISASGYSVVLEGSMEPWIEDTQPS